MRSAHQAAVINSLLHQRKAHERWRGGESLQLPSTHPVVSRSIHVVLQAPMSRFHRDPNMFLVSSGSRPKKMSGTRRIVL